MEKPAVLNPIPAQMVNERASFGPLDLKAYISDGVSFTAELGTGDALPKGLICTSDGILTGIPGANTEGNYEILLTVENDEGSLHTSLMLTIKPSMVGGEGDYFDKLKAQVWEALDQKLPAPDFTELFDRPVTLMDVYYLLERFGLLKIWDAFNLEAPGEKVLLNLEGVSKHYEVYDRGSCLVASPKDLFSHERTLADGLQTAQAMAREVYRRGWTVELVGLQKLTRAAWVEIQRLGEIYEKPLEVINYNSSPYDIQLVEKELVKRQSPER